jgi:hypothetical protein
MLVHIEARGFIVRFEVDRRRDPDETAQPPIVEPGPSASVEHANEPTTPELHIGFRP